MELQNDWDERDEGKTERARGGMAKGVVIGAAATLIIGIAGFFLFCLATGTQIVVTDADTLLDADALSKINELEAYIDAYYYDEVDADALKDGLYEGLLEGVGDKYSVYYNAEDYEALQVSTTGKYYGIGAGLSQDADTMVVTISKVYEGTPSEAAGLLKDDIILSVDGTEADTMEVSELVKLIRGDEGTTVHLEIYRPSTGEYLSFDVERADITLPSVSHKMFDDGIGYIYIDSFETDTASQFEEALADLESEGLKALILDVRYNPGGMVTSVVRILDDILPEGTVVYTQDKYGNREDYTSDGETYLDVPIAVLINGDSASASEIFAGAIKDFEYGTLIGTTTYGKGIVQTIFTLEDGDAVKLTTAKYFTPNGSYIHGVGIEPDIELEYEYLDADGESYEEAYDNQIQKAIEVLGEKLAE